MTNPGRFSVFLALFSLLAACGDGPPSPSPGAAVDAPSRLIRGNGADPGTLDPGFAEAYHAFNVIADLYEGLIATDAGGRLIPGVAERWEISGDGLTYTFYLRDGARWSNGDALIAGDFIRALDRVTAVDSAAPLGFLLESIDEYSQLNDRQLVIRLNRPTSYFLSILTMPVAMPIHSQSDSDAAHVPASISNGAYTLKAWEIGSRIELERNPYYWDAGNVAIDEVHYLPIVDEYAELNAYRAGQLHITNSIPDSSLEQLREDEPGQTHIGAVLGLYYLAFDLTEPPFDDLDVRRALSMAVDREQLVDLLGRGEQPAYGIVPPGTTGHRNPGYPWRTSDQAARLAEARALLAEAGYAPDRPLEFTYLYDAGGIHERVALAVGSMWEATLPVKLDFEKREWQYFLDARETRDEWQLMRFAWFGDYDDPDTFLQIFTTESGQNLPKVANAEFDRALAEANSMVSAAARSDALTRAEKLLLDDYPVAPLYFLVSKHLVQESIRGFESNVLDRHPSRFMSFR